LQKTLPNNVTCAISPSMKIVIVRATTDGKFICDIDVDGKPRESWMCDDLKSMLQGIPEVIERMLK
jgi:hypothetical protein